MTGEVEGFKRGITPRSIEEILVQSIAMQALGWNISISTSIIEIYNEEIRDLLCTANSSSNALLQDSNSNNNNTKSKYKIVKTNGRVAVQGLTSINIDTNSKTIEVGLEQFKKLLESSTQLRSTASTGMNEVSSRSHQIVMIEIFGKHEDGVTTFQGGLRLCDLAGCFIIYCLLFLLVTLLFS
jgi:hypothetical protein